jgi:hypothetical protein
MRKQSKVKVWGWESDLKQRYDDDKAMKRKWDCH